LTSQQENNKVIESYTDKMDKNDAKVRVIEGKLQRFEKIVDEVSRYDKRINILVSGSLILTI
jgi:hypothetical protein